MLARLFLVLLVAWSALIFWIAYSGGSWDNPEMPRVMLAVWGAPALFFGGIVWALNGFKAS